MDQKIPAHIPIRYDLLQLLLVISCKNSIHAQLYKLLVLVSHCVGQTINSGHKVYSSLTFSM